ncbi:MAG: hypothetical protein N2037_08650 [Acidimicrobiales bacterium]|nr:hypothetical protein [Acidimicrobiales bacterium]
MSDATSPHSASQPPGQSGAEEAEESAHDASYLKGMFRDASTLASAGLLVAVLLAVVAGLLKVLVDPGIGDVEVRLLALTDTVDVGDVALLGIAVALLLLTPDPPGGIPRPVLMQLDAVLAGVIAVFGVIRAVVLLIWEGSALFRFAECLATMGVALAAATVSYYAAKESFLKERGQI